MTYQDVLNEDLMDYGALGKLTRASPEHKIESRAQAHLIMNFHFYGGVM